jgi:opacity protein-like surface antigen
MAYRARSVKRITSLLSVCFLIASPAHAGTMGVAPCEPSRIYIGAFGGGGALMANTDLGQFGTAFYPSGPSLFFQPSIGPLAVNALGDASSVGAWLAGGRIGYRWSGFGWPFVPATELEAYYIGGATIKGNDLDNNTTRLVSHEFQVSFPQETAVFLVNGVLNANFASFGRWQPYLGFGIGSAVISVKNAVASQIVPSEPGINHFGAHTNAETAVFAAQPKVGIQWSINPKLQLFAEYRFLYLSDSHYTFGSAAVPTHVATSSWQVNIGPQYYNFGTLGIQYDL